jgi:hypothetical protein
MNVSERFFEECKSGTPVQDVAKKFSDDDDLVVMYAIDRRFEMLGNVTGGFLGEEGLVFWFSDSSVLFLLMSDVDARKIVFASIDPPNSKEEELAIVELALEVSSEFEESVAKYQPKFHQEYLNRKEEDLIAKSGMFTPTQDINGKKKQYLH